MKLNKGNECGLNNFEMVNKELSLIWLTVTGKVWIITAVKIYLTAGLYVLMVVNYNMSAAYS